MTLQQIEAIICKEANVLPSELHTTTKRYGDLIELKYIIISLAMSFGRRRGDLAIRERDCAEYFGHNIENPSVVSYARKWVNRRCKVDKEFAERYYALKELVNGKKDYSMAFFLTDRVARLRAEADDLIKQINKLAV